MTVEPGHQPAPPLGPLTAAKPFLAAYEIGETAAVVAFCASDAKAFYVPGGDAGAGPFRTAVTASTCSPAAFDRFSAQIVEVSEDTAAGIAVASTTKRGRQLTAIHGIRSAGHTIACAHLFKSSVDRSAQITCVEVLCNQSTRYRQLGFPEGVVVETRA